MNRFFRNLYLTLVGTVVFAVVLTVLSAYVWHKGAFRWAYQFVTSAGLLACGLYFLTLSKGDAPSRVKWGLTLLLLSPAFFLASNALFWPAPAAASSATGSLYFLGKVDLVGFLMEAQVAPRVPVLLLATVGFLVGNAAFIARNVGKKRTIGGNLLMLGWTVIAYWMAYSQA